VVPLDRLWELLSVTQLGIVWDPRSVMRWEFGLGHELVTPSE